MNPTAPLSEPQHAPATPVPARVLVVDDDPALRRMVSLVLSFEGFDVAVADDGIHGLEELEAGGFQAVVLDLQMPRMDGRAMFEEMRSRGDHTPVLLLSAYGAEQASKELGADAGLAKPFDVDVLVDTVRSLFTSAEPTGNEAP